MADELEDKGTPWCGWWPPVWKDEIRHWRRQQFNLRRAVISLQVGKLFCLEDWTKITLTETTMHPMSDFPGKYRVYSMHSGRSVEKSGNVLFDTILEVRCYLQVEAETYEG